MSFDASLKQRIGMNDMETINSLDTAAEDIGQAAALVQMLLDAQRSDGATAATLRCVALILDRADVTLALITGPFPSRREHVCSHAQH
jgi:hypothetical protein